MLKQARGLHGESLMLCARFARSIPAALAVALACVAHAQVDYRDADVHLKDIIGMRVQSASGEALGVIKDLVFDPRTGRIVYIAVEQPQQGATMSRYPVDVLVAGRPGEVVVDESLVSSSAGASARAGQLQTHGFSFANAERGRDDPVVDLLEGKLRVVP
jgi:sporulation protein YlmC with PRC-barrel domain